MRNNNVAKLKYSIFIFVGDNGTTAYAQVKLSKFCTLRPQHVKLVGQTPRNTSNFIQCCDGLHKYIPQLPTYGPEMIDFLVCDNPTRDCYFKTCKECTTTNITKTFLAISKLPEYKNKPVEWMQWVKKEKENRYINELQKGTTEKLINYFLKIHAQFLMHSYTKREQANAFNNDRKSVEENVDVAVLQIDFAENYKCEAQKEIQPANYNQKQVREQEQS